MISSTEEWIITFVFRYQTIKHRSNNIPWLYRIVPDRIPTPYLHFIHRHPLLQPKMMIMQAIIIITLWAPLPVCKTSQHSYKTHKYERIAGLSLSTQPSIAVWSSSIQSRVRWAKSSREEKEPQQPRGGSKEVGSKECEMEMAWDWSKRILPNDLTLPPGCTLPVSVDTHSQVGSRLSALSLSVHRHRNHFLSRLRGLWTHWLPEEEFKGGCRWWLVVKAEKEMASSSFQIGSRMRIFCVWAEYFYGGNATNNNMYL